MFRSIFLSSTLYFLLLPSCMSSSPSYEQLKQDVLNSACNSAVRQDLEQAIEGQRRILNDEQMIKSLQNMKKEIQCG